MAPSFDCAVSSLLCAEDNTSIFDEVDDNYGVIVEDDFEICNWKHENPQNFNNTINDNINHHINNQDQNFISGEAYFSGVFVPSDECLASLFDKERQHFLGLDYLKRFTSGDLDLGARNLAIDWIEKVVSLIIKLINSLINVLIMCYEQVQSHYNFGPLCVYLSVNYLDRFLSAYELPKGKNWMMQLLAVACLSLAAKLEETDVPLSLDLQVGETKFIFEAKTIQRMELLVLSTLKWRMQSVTPFSFIDYYLYKLSGDKMPSRSLIFQAVQLILSTIKGIDLMEFRPSEIAAAAAISVLQETQIVVEQLTDKALSFLIDHEEKKRIMKCVELMHDMRMNNRMNNDMIAARSVPQSPIGVLEAACLSFSTTTTTTSTTMTTATTTPSESCANSVHSSPAPAPKRRKLDNTLASS
ncbi:Cyclin-D2-1 [Bienertia sinuspersici]